MKRYLPVLAASALMIGSAALDGSWTGRWRQSGDMERAVARLKSTGWPGWVGASWKGHTIDVGDRALRIARIDGYTAWVYENQQTGESVRVLAVCGQPGPIVAHTPDVCFTSTGYEKLSQRPVVFRFGAQGQQVADFTLGVFRYPEAAAEQQLNVYWAWSARGAWQSPPNPRLHFAREPFLYKIYVIVDSAPGEEASDRAAFREFMNQFLTAVNGALFSTT